MRIVQNTPNDDIMYNGDVELTKNANAVVTDVKNIDFIAVPQQCAKRCERLGKLFNPDDFQLSKNMKISSAPIPDTMKKLKMWNIPKYLYPMMYVYTKFDARKEQTIINIESHVIQ